MSFATKHNKRRFNVNTEGFAYMSMHDLFGQNGAEQIYPIAGLFINTKGKFGAAPVAATSAFFINLPSHMVDTVENILNDGEAVEDINAGKVGMKIYAYTSHNKECFGVEWVDL